MVDGPDNRRSLVVAVAGFFTITVLSGMFRSQGLLFVEFMSFYGVGRKEASLPFTVKTSMRNIIAPVVGVLGQRYGVAAVTLTGAVLNSLNCLLCLLAPDIGWMTFTWGILGGACGSLSDCLIPVVIGQYFLKHRTSAIGFVYSGSTVGAFVMPIILEALLLNYGLQGTYYLLAGIYLQNVPAAMFFTKPIWMTENGEYESPARNIGTEQHFNDRKHSGDHESGCEINQLLPESGCELNQLLPESGRELNQPLLESGRELNPPLLESGRELNQPLLESGRELNQPLLESRLERNYVFPESEPIPKQIRSESETKLSQLLSKRETHLNQILTENEIRFEQLLSKSRSEQSVPGSITELNQLLPGNVGEQKLLMRSQDAQDRRHRSDCASKILDRHIYTFDQYFDKKPPLETTLNNKAVVEFLTIEPQPRNEQDTATCSVKVLSSPSHSSGTPAKKSVPGRSLLHHVKNAIKLYSKPIFLLICFTRLAFFVTLSPFVTVIVDFAIDKGMTESEAVAAIPALSTGDLVGRLCSGWITDRGYVELPRLISAALLLQGMSSILIAFMYSKWTLLCSIALFGVLQGSLYIRHFILVSENLEADEQSIAIGCMDFFAGVVGVFAPLYIGYFRDVIGSYNPLFFLNGALLMTVGITWLLEPYLWKH